MNDTKYCKDCEHYWLPVCKRWRRTGGRKYECDAFKDKPKPTERKAAK